MSARCLTEGCGAYARRGHEYCQAHQMQQEQAAKAADQEAAFTEAAPAAPRAAKSRVAEPDPAGVENEVVGAALAQILLKQEARARFQEAQRRAQATPRDKEGFRLPEHQRRTPFKVVPRRKRQDPTAILDPITGETPAALRADWVQKWVRTHDHLNRPTRARVGELEDYGYETIRDCEGRVIETALGVAMQAPPEQYALRVAEKSRELSFTRDDYLSAAMEGAETINRMADSQVTRVVISDEHKSQRVLHSSGLEPLEE